MAPGQAFPHLAQHGCCSLAMRSVKIHESQVLVVQTVYWRDILQMYVPSKLVSQEETCPYNFLHKRKGRFCKPRPSKQVSKLHKWKSSKKVEVCKTSFFKQVGFSCCKKGQWRYATALRPKSGLPLPPREKLDGQRKPLVVIGFGALSEPLGK